MIKPGYIEITDNKVNFVYQVFERVGITFEASKRTVEVDNKILPVKDNVSNEIQTNKTLRWILLPHETMANWVVIANNQSCKAKVNDKAIIIKLN